MTAPIRLGGRHCCVCSGVCMHIGGPYVCAEHEHAPSATEPDRCRRELTAARIIEENLRDRVSTLEARVKFLERTEAVHFDLWCREVPPGWRMWRIKRRRAALEER